MLIDEPPPSPSPVALVPIGEMGETAALKLAEDLRGQGFTIDLGYSGNLARRLRRANRINAFAAILLGEDELARGAATLRDLNGGTQQEVPLAELSAALEALAGKRGKVVG